MEITLENKIDLYYLLKKNYSNLYYRPILMGHPVCENEIIKFSRSYFDPLELKNTKMFVNTEISLT